MNSIFVSLAAASALVAADLPLGTLAGKVLDPSGGAVVGAVVSLTHLTAGSEASVIADQEGRFLVRDLVEGRYKLTAESPGFTPYSRVGVELRKGQRAVFDVMLSISPISEVVTVTAKAPTGEGAFETRPHNTREILEIREVRESAAKDVGEAVSNLEGLWRIRKGGIANDVVLRGFQQGNLNVLIDGVRVYGACPNHMDPSAFHVDFAEIETVQVIKGPFDIRNQGSLGGSVNVATKRPADGVRLTPNLTTGSSGYYNPAVHGSYSVGGLYALGGYSHRRSETYRDGSGRRATDYANYTAQGRDNLAFDVDTGWLKAGAKFRRSQTLEVAYTRQQGGLTLYPYLLMDAMYDNADRTSASWNARELNDVVRQIRAEAYFTRVRHWMTDELRVSSAGAPRGFGMASFAATKALGGRLEAELPGTLIGLEGYRRNWEAVNTMRMSGVYQDQPSMPGVRMLVGGFYGQHRRVFGRLQLTAGARLDSASSEARGSNLDTAIYWAYQRTRSTTKGELKPAATLWATFALPMGLELFGGIGSTVRLPDPQERYFTLKRSGSDWVGNPNLKPTRNNEVDLGISIRASRFSLRPTLFYSRVDDFVALYSQRIQNLVPGIMNSAARSYENVDARIYGGEVSYSLGFRRSVLLSGGVSFVRGTQFVKSAEALPAGNIAEMPPLKSRTSLRYGNRVFFVEVEGRAVARQERINLPLREQPTPGYGLLGLRGGIHRNRLNLAAGSDNLLNRFYYDHLSFQRDPFRTGVRIPDPGRSFYLNLSIVFE